MVMVLEAVSSEELENMVVKLAALHIEVPPDSLNSFMMVEGETFKYDSIPL